MGITVKDWLKREMKTHVCHWMDFAVGMLSYIVGIVLAVPVLVLHAIGAGITAICNAIFYRVPVDDTFFELIQNNPLSFLTK